jgi:hypothetical protein
MSAPDIPNKYTITTNADADVNTTIGGTITANTNLGGSVTANTNLAGSLTMTVLGDAAKPVAAKMDATVDVKNLPHFTMADFLSLIDTLKKPDLRARFPVQLNFGISVFPLNLFGIDALQFSICGEPQVILQPYVPNAYERCEVDCQPCDCT